MAESAVENTGFLTSRAHHQCSRTPAAPGLSLHEITGVSANFLLNRNPANLICWKLDGNFAFHTKHFLPEYSTGIVVSSLQTPNCWVCTHFPFSLISTWFHVLPPHVKKGKFHHIPLTLALYLICSLNNSFESTHYGGLN